MNHRWKRIAPGEHGFALLMEENGHLEIHCTVTRSTFAKRSGAFNWRWGTVAVFAVDGVVWNVGVGQHVATKAGAQRLAILAIPNVRAMLECLRSQRAGGTS